MARTSNITFGQVAAIADAMKAAGTRPTARAVRERIGSGSMGTIHKLLQQWQGKGNETGEDSEPAELPAHIQNALMDFIGTEIATACEPLNAELQAAKEAAEHIASENERLESVIDRLQRERDEAQLIAVKSQTERDIARNALSGMESLTDELRLENTEQKRTIDAYIRQGEELANLRHQFIGINTKAEILSARAIEAETATAVLTAQLTAETAKANELSERLKTAESRANAQTEEIKQANNHYQACAARLEAAAREIESLRKPAAPKVATPKPASNRTSRKTTAKELYEAKNGNS